MNSDVWLTLPDGRSWTLAQIAGLAEYDSWFPIPAVKPGDCIHCGKECCNEYGWCNSFKAAPDVKEPK